MGTFYFSGSIPAKSTYKKKELVVNGWDSVEVDALEHFQQMADSLEFRHFRTSIIGNDTQRIIYVPKDPVNIEDYFDLIHYGEEAQDDRSPSVRTLLLNVCSYNFYRGSQNIQDILDVYSMYGFNNLDVSSR